MKIILLRHGKPVLPPLSRISAADFSHWVNKYNAAGLCNSSKPPADTVKLARHCNTIVCSQLKRSIESANALSESPIYLIDKLFNEAELPVANWKHLKLSPKFWSVFFRICWIFGYKGHCESVKQARTRAKRSVERLEQLSHTNDCVLFIGHGVYNRLIADELIRSGWSGPRHPGTRHWAYTIYTR